MCGGVGYVWRCGMCGGWGIWKCGVCEGVWWRSLCLLICNVGMGREMASNLATGIAGM